MQLFKVGVLWETVILAKDLAEAKRLAPRVIRHEDQDHQECNAKLIKCLDDLPSGWDAGCRPWGETEPMDRTIGKIIELNAISASPNDT